MSKIKKRLIVFALAIAMAVTLVPWIGGTNVVEANAASLTKDEVNSRINYICSQLEGKVFGVDQNNGCGYKSTNPNHNQETCYNCSNYNVIETGWFQAAFGSVSINQFPEYATPGGGTMRRRADSCAGFASFAEWAIFNGGSGDSVTTYKVGEGAFTYDYMSNNARLGDIIRIRDMYHSAIVLEVNPNGCYVLDCNWTDGGSLPNSIVRRHTIGWDGSDVVAISRASCEIVNGNNPTGFVDSVESTGDRTISIKGWAYDQDKPNDSISVYVCIGGENMTVPGCEEHGVPTNTYRSDVNSKFGITGNHGFESEIKTDKIGWQDVYIYAINVGEGSNILLEHVHIYIKYGDDPIGTYEMITSEKAGTIRVRGYCYDPDVPEDSIQIYVTVGGPAMGDGIEAHGAAANIQRDDLNAKYGVSGAHGFDATINVEKTGIQDVYVYALNHDQPNGTLLGNTKVSIGVASSPKGELEEIGSDYPGTIYIKGWAFDSDVPNDQITIYTCVDGLATTPQCEDHGTRTTIERTDINSKYGLSGTHGFEERISTNKTGTKEVWVFALNVNSGESVLLWHTTVRIMDKNTDADLQFKEAEVELKEGEETQLEFEATPDGLGAFGLTWNSTDETVAKVDTTGTVQALQPGTATVTVAVGDYKATCQVKVVRSGYSNEWVEEDGKKYYYDQNGNMVTGIQKINNVRYIFNEDGILQTGWYTLDGKTYYMAADGAVQYGALKIKVGGVMRTFYFDKNGVRQDGFITIKGNTYYFDAVNGMQKGSKKIGKDWYYFNSKGVMQTGWITSSGKTFYFKEDGTRAKGLLEIDGKKYYFGSNGVMSIGWLEKSGKKFYFNADGSMQFGWKKLNNKYYFFNGKGVMVTGWLQKKGNWYYLQDDGTAFMNGTLTIGSKTYVFDSKGICQNP